MKNAIGLKAKCSVIWSDGKRVGTYESKVKGKQMMILTEDKRIEDMNLIVQDEVKL